MILLVDNYDSFTYNLAQYIGRIWWGPGASKWWSELVPSCPRSRCLGLFSRSRLAKGCGQDGGDDPRFRGGQTNLGDLLGASSDCGSFGGRFGIGATGHAWQTKPDPARSSSPLYAGVAKEVPVMRYHSLTIEDMPEDFVITSRTTDDQAIMGIQHRSLPIYGFQYHPESIGTPDGLKTIENFVKLVKERKMKQVLAKVAEGMDLTSAELEAAMEEVCRWSCFRSTGDGPSSRSQNEGETVEERTAIAKVMQAYAVTIPTEVQGAMDNCGTGGDRSYSFNISTTAAFVLAGGGIKMAKHGNRSISSKSGSADVPRSSRD